MHSSEQQLQASVHRVKNQLPCNVLAVLLADRWMVGCPLFSTVHAKLSDMVTTSLKHVLDAVSPEDCLQGGRKASSAQRAIAAFTTDMLEHIWFQNIHRGSNAVLASTDRGQQVAQG